MMDYERRRTERELYGTLRALARLQSVSSYAALALGIVAAAILVVFVPAAGLGKLAGTIILLLSGWMIYFNLRAQAQMIYILFDIARDSRVTRELLEKIPAE